ncbi:MAG: YceI family protein [Spirochaetia bacterium]|nr:YceI family protein [Spirochaetia bacterium]
MKIFTVTIMKKHLLNLLVPGILLIFFASAVSAVDLKDETLKITSGKMLFTLVKTTPQGDSKMSGLANKFKGSINFKDKTVSVTMDINQDDFLLSGKFKFANNRMHVTYLESEKYTNAVFSGQVVSFDPESGKFSVRGNMTLHGVTKSNFLIDCMIEKTKKANEYLLTSSFKINLTDFKIPVPDIGLAKVNEVVGLKTKFILSVEK